MELWKVLLGMTMRPDQREAKNVRSPASERFCHSTVPVGSLESNSLHLLHGPRFRGQLLSQV